MKESIYTIPLMDAFSSDDECPFCHIQRDLEQHAIDFALGRGASYMESDFREKTDEAGFCREHYKKMYDYGNRLGSALILSTHFKKLNQELEAEIKRFSYGKTSLLKKLKKNVSDISAPQTSIGSWVQEKEKRCFICEHMNQNYGRYIDTFFELYLHEPVFQELFLHSRGFCLHHFSQLTEAGAVLLNEKQKKEFFGELFPLMQENMKRLEEEVLWFTAKYDYQNRDKSWGTSQDSVQRCMQKDRGGHPSDPPYTYDR